MKLKFDFDLRIFIEVLDMENRAIIGVRKITETFTRNFKCNYSSWYYRYINISYLISLHEYLHISNSFTPFYYERPILFRDASFIIIEQIRKNTLSRKMKKKLLKQRENFWITRNKSNECTSIIHNFQLSSVHFEQSNSSMC